MRAVPCLNPGGRLAVITFHSLEDRIVKNAMAAGGQGLHLPAGSSRSASADRKPQVKIITRKPITSGGGGAGASIPEPEARSFGFAKNSDKFE